MGSGIFLNRVHKNRDIGKDATTQPVDAEVPEKPFDHVQALGTLLKCPAHV